jgi:hypothetical protein
MLNKVAEERFREGLEAFKINGSGLRAKSLFESALEIDLKENNTHGQARYRSYLGLCMVLRDQDVRTGLSLCRQAAEEEFFNQQMWLNLGRAEMKAGNRWRAHKALVRAWRLSPGRPETVRELQRLGLRRPVFLSFLSRNHWINILLGKMSHRLSRKKTGD